VSSERQRARVLVVEDEPEIGDAVADVLTGQGYSVETARNGLEALERARAFPPQVIVLDLTMLVMHGMEFLAAKRGVAALAPVPVIVQTAHHPAPLTGCEVLYKPYTLEALLDAAHRCLAPQRAEAGR
jgi:CheY-like chemotaxis protein